jgi:hypothetical protein
MTLASFKSYCKLERCYSVKAIQNIIFTISNIKIKFLTAIIPLPAAYEALKYAMKFGLFSLFCCKELSEI